MMKLKLICPKCGQEFEIDCSETVVKNGKYRKFCSRQCANSRSYSDETKNKISISLKKASKMKVCPICGKQFSGRRKTCSDECLRVIQQENGRKLTRQTIVNGTHKGWQSRNITSYAEKFWMSVLDNNNINYQREFHVGNYFLDFFIETNGKKIDLEIDGKQHEFRIEHDKIRDSFIEAQGFVVYRIKWNKMDGSKNLSDLTKQKIDDFLKFYKELSIL
jgi:very-short-patch-repair endonuclease